MLVKDLIELLKKQNPEAHVFCRDYEIGYRAAVTKVDFDVVEAVHLHVDMPSLIPGIENAKERTKVLVNEALSSINSFSNDMEIISSELRNLKHDYDL